MILQSTMFLVMVCTQWKHGLRHQGKKWIDQFLRFAIGLPHLMSNFLGNKPLENWTFISLSLCLTFFIEATYPVQGMLLKVLASEVFSLVTLPLVISSLKGWTQDSSTFSYVPFAKIYISLYTASALVYFLLDQNQRVTIEFVTFPIISCVCFLQWVFNSSQESQSVQLSGSSKIAVDKLIYAGRYQGRHLVVAKQRGLSLFDASTGQKLKTAMCSRSSRTRILQVFADTEKQLIIYIVAPNGDKIQELHVLTLAGFKLICSNVLEDDLLCKHVVYDNRNMTICYLQEEGKQTEQRIAPIWFKSVSILDGKTQIHKKLKGDLNGLGLAEETCDVSFNLLENSDIVTKSGFCPSINIIHLFGELKSEHNPEKKLNSILNTTESLQTGQEYETTFGSPCLHQKGQFICEEITQILTYKDYIIVSSFLNIYVLSKDSLMQLKIIDTFHAFATASFLSDKEFIVNLNDDYYVCNIEPQNLQLNVTQTFKISSGQNPLMIAQLCNSKKIIISDSFAIKSFSPAE